MKPKLTTTNYTQIIKETYPLIANLDTLQNAIPTPPMTAYCKATNLQKLLVRAELNPSLGVHCCHLKRCSLCQHLHPAYVFTSCTTGKYDRTKQHLHPTPALTSSVSGENDSVKQLPICKSTNNGLCNHMSTDRKKETGCGQNIQDLEITGHLS